MRIVKWVRLMRAAELALSTRLFGKEEWDQIVKDSAYRYVNINAASQEPVEVELQEVRAESLDHAYKQDLIERDVEPHVERVDVERQAPGKDQQTQRGSPKGKIVAFSGDQAPP